MNNIMNCPPASSHAAVNKPPELAQVPPIHSPVDVRLYLLTFFLSLSCVVFVI